MARKPDDVILIDGEFYLDGEPSVYAYQRDYDKQAKAYADTLLNEDGSIDWARFQEVFPAHCEALQVNYGRLLQRCDIGLILSLGDNPA